MMAIHSMMGLTHLDLGRNQFSGTFPAWFADLTLQSITVSDNFLEGTLPQSLMRLGDRLELLAVDGNRMGGNLAALQSLTGLRILYLENNQFQDTMDDTFLLNMPELIQLDASDNLLNGTLPVHLLDNQRMKSLQVLDLSRNHLTGSLPTALLTRNTVLDFLSLHHNQLTGQIPDSLCNNLEMLYHLDLASNRLSGPLPDSLGMGNLRHLFLAENGFDPGPIPEAYRRLIQLRDLSLGGTQRTGTIPRWLGGLRQLILLDLDSNQLNGTLPIELGHLSYLSLLFLSRNQLSGTMPTELGVLGRLCK